MMPPTRNGGRVHARPPARAALSPTQAYLSGRLARVLYVEPAKGMAACLWGDDVKAATGSRLHAYPLAWLVEA